MIKNKLTQFFIISALCVSTVNAEQRLSATIIGSGSPLYNENRASASVLISNGETNLLLDMGNGTQANLNKLGIGARDLSGLLFTHHHLDHNEEFVPIFIGSLLGRNDFTIIGPPNTTKLAQVNLELYQEDIQYRLGKTQRSLETRKDAFKVTDIVGGESFTIDDIRISTVEVPHTIHTIAYRFDYNNQSIVVSGDLTYSAELATLARHADYMIMDSGGMVMSDGNKKKRKMLRIKRKMALKNRLLERI
ncbi:MBL fold metallo-hydrolase [Psychromonas sp. KJ10-10]|uniref:MBL fold metallo-hydrolase n=1 Tax=Psychromonas sp. KJ10-10 TaxID=3391823 RepID=UPI0039B64364